MAKSIKPCRNVGKSKFKQGLNNAFKSTDHVQYTNGYNKAMQDFLEYLKHCSTFTDMNGNTYIDNDLLNTLIDDFKNYIEEITKKEFYELMEGGKE